MVGSNFFVSMSTYYVNDRVVLVSGIWHNFS